MKTRKGKKRETKKHTKTQKRSPLPQKFKNYGDGIVYMVFDGHKHVFKFVANRKL